MKKSYTHRGGSTSSSTATLIQPAAHNNYLHQISQSFLKQQHTREGSAAATVSDRSHH